MRGAAPRPARLAALTASETAFRMGKNYVLSLLARRSREGSCWLLEAVRTW